MVIHVVLLYVQGEVSFNWKNEAAVLKQCFVIVKRPVLSITFNDGHVNSEEFTSPQKISWPVAEHRYYAQAEFWGRIRCYLEQIPTSITAKKWTKTFRT